MKKELYEKIINLCLEHGCDFAEVYYEQARKTNYILLDKKLDDIPTNQTEGVGIRVEKNGNIYYSSTNTLTEENILNKTRELLQNVPKTKSKQNTACTLGELLTKLTPVKIAHNDFSIVEKVKLLKKIDKTARTISKFIVQVRVLLLETDKQFVVANSYGKFVKSDEITTRLACICNSERDNKKESSFKSAGAGIGYEFLEKVNLDDFAKEVATSAVKKLDSKAFEGGEVPVIIGTGFGAVIFHEACGHALEATSVCDGLSVFTGCLNKKIASEKVTLIDDGSIPGEWGSTLIDSEGNETQKNILIENGILKKFLIDDRNSIKMKQPSTSSGRRQDYTYPPTSRMNNTYLAAGTDKFEDMVKSIDYGLYCKKMSGGSVDTKTGEFNFSADECYLIKNGNIGDIVTGITLIGKGQDILKAVEMVADDLSLETGYCGSESGNVPVTIGEPTIKVSKILVGGTAE